MKLYLSVVLVLIVSTSSCSLLEEADNADFNNELTSSEFYSPGFRIDLGTSHSCAMRVYGTVQCWGSNSNGELGDGITSASGKLTPVTVYGISNAIDVAAGNGHSCAVLSSGTVQCWGGNGLS